VVGGRLSRKKNGVGPLRDGEALSVERKRKDRASVLISVRL
jgi:hypothetical protein